ncbi:unnamed protein product [Paramecium primaurelia]|uniref:Uncharacterized protein n=2 Tax=Paramecium TaxID=5884 RepID=A0A8S1XK25_9CILI|nr:unnamed protein product [Paramecium primaurelia]CAD8201516.1 unnamed protein product [Paramecium pentaurelia]
MSITVSTCQQICGSPLNHSTAKNLWTFSKSDRFGNLANPVNCGKAFYDLPTQIDKRSAGIGKGTKTDFTKVAFTTPSPQQYNITSDVEINQKKAKGNKFGMSREKMASTGILGNLNSKTPAPGTYDLGSTLSDIRYTMRQRPKTNFMVLTGKEIPGPGTYESLPAVNPVGKYPISKYNNSCATLFNPKNSKRFVKDFSTNLYAPGPGTYPVDKTGIQKDGHYFISKFHSSNVRSFPKESRRTGSVGKAGTPAPGSYRLPSEFGYYESRNKANRSAGDMGESKPQQ